MFLPLPVGKECWRIEVVILNLLKSFTQRTLICIKNNKTTTIIIDNIYNMIIVMIVAITVHNNV